MTGDGCLGIDCSGTGGFGLLLREHHGFETCDGLHGPGALVLVLLGGAVHMVPK